MRVRAPLLAAVAALLACAAPASADIYDVTTAQDGAGACPPARGLQCTLRQAVTNANNNTATTSDTINVPAGDYVLNPQFGQLTILGSTAIVGANAATTTIRGNKSNFRVFQVGSEQPITVTMQHLTIADGASTGAGGNILVQGSTLALLHVRVTGGAALRGGGIALSNSSAAILRSLIDGNKAISAAGAGPSGEGGGIAAFGNPQAARILGIADTTITGNTASTGGGLLVRDNPSNTTTLTRDTIAFNAASSTTGGGIYLADAEPLNVAGTIVSNNTGNVSQVAVVIGPSNCGGAKLTSNGSNVESLADCNFITTGDRRNANPQLSTQLTSAGGETQVLTIPSTSPALDLIPTAATICTGSPTFDQRDVARPIGAGCDAGAYEADFVAPPTSIDSGPSGTTTDTTASFTFSSREAGATFDCRLDGPGGQGVFAHCTSPATFSNLAPGAYTFFVRATDAAGNTSTASSRSFTVTSVQPGPTPTPTPTPTPVPNKSVVVQPLSGKVLVKLPGSSKFEPVDVTRGIPNGATVDVRKGKIELFAIPKAGKPVEHAMFYDGIFKLKLAGGITELQLTEALSCPKAGKADVSAKKPKSRKLWGSGSGSFRTRGQYSAATVRGTTWLVQDTCTTTLTRVTKGVVSVNDFVKHKTILLRAPKKYIARKKH
jgi:hypothetical protein